MGYGLGLWVRALRLPLATRRQPPLRRGPGSAEVGVDGGDLRLGGVRVEVRVGVKVRVRVMVSVRISIRVVLGLG